MTFTVKDHSHHSLCLRVFVVNFLSCKKHVLADSCAPWADTSHEHMYIPHRRPRQELPKPEDICLRCRMHRSIISY
jgi:hypothetical protein